MGLARFWAKPNEQFGSHLLTDSYPRYTAELVQDRGPRTMTIEQICYRQFIDPIRRPQHVVLEIQSLREISHNARKIRFLEAKKQNWNMQETS